MKIEGKLLTTETADQVGCSQRSVSNVLKKPRLTGNVRDLKVHLKIHLKKGKLRKERTE